MSQGIEVVVCHHLGIAACSAGEIHQHGVVVGVDMLGPHKGGCIFYLSIPVMEAFADDRSHAHEHIDGGALGHGSQDLTDDILLSHTDDAFYRGAVVTVNDIFLGEHMGGGDGDGANLTEGEHRNPPLQTALQDEHHHVAMADT